jgi:NAD(P)-dependent dehydrogenase (short-subunit alcohol dehydrogenase family)
MPPITTPIATSLDGAVALVTGAAGGLGSAVTRRLHARGATVVLFDQAEEATDGLATELEDRAIPVVGDALGADAQHAVEVAVRAGPLRYLVACAGGGRGGQRTVGRSGQPHDLDLFTETMELNVTATFNVLRLAAAAMAGLDPYTDDGERGSIVLTSSIAAFEGQIGTIAYATAKAAINGMTITAARDLAAAGIRVNTIAPGTMGTAAWEHASADVRRTLEEKVPFPRRFGKPEEFADAVEHLLTNRYMNGHILRLDGAIRFDPK